MILRKLHLWFGLPASIVMLILALSGTVLSVQPALEQWQAFGSTNKLSTAELVSRIMEQQPGVELIRRSANGVIRAEMFTDGQAETLLVNAQTGTITGTEQQSAFMEALVEFHRNLFLSDNGRWITGMTAATLLLLSLTGLVMAVRRQSGWRGLLNKPMGGNDHGSRHFRFSRLAIAGLFISALTGIWLSLDGLGLLPEAPVATYPTEVSGLTGVDLSQSLTLQQLPLTDFRELRMPYVDDSSDSYYLLTNSGEGYIDQGTGALLSWQDATVLQQIGYLALKLHTGEGLWWLGLILGLSSLAVPVLAWTGVNVSLRRHRAGTGKRANHAIDEADMIILVGSESGTTQGFARTLHTELERLGYRVCTTMMNRYRFNHRPQALFILTSTYGNGEAPASADQFLANLAAADAWPVTTAVVGFGDRQYPGFCAFAEQVSRVLNERGWPQLLPLYRINRQSVQAFAQWGRELGKVLNQPVVLAHQLSIAKMHGLTLIERRTFGADPQTQTAVLRFAVAKGRFWQRQPDFVAGDLIGIYPPGSNTVRHYSLASSHRDGFVEICVRRHPHGRCSSWLHELRPGDQLEVFFQMQPQFHAKVGSRPLLMIGAGTGIGPLAGFIRANEDRRPMHLYFGARHPNADFLYQQELEQWQRNGRLTNLTTAFSQGDSAAYVQDRLLQDAIHIRRLIDKGADILVCGGRGMAEGVQHVLADILAPMGLNLVTLKQEGRYAEDVY